MSATVHRWMWSIFAALLAMAPLHAAAPDAIERALRADDGDTAEALARARLAAESRGGHEGVATLDAIDTLVDVLLDLDRIDAADLDVLLAREEALARSLRTTAPRALARARMRKAAALASRRDYPAFVAATRELEAAAGAFDDPALGEIDVQLAYRAFYLERDPAGGLARATALVAALERSPAAGLRLRAKALRLHARMLLDAQRLDEAELAMRAYEAFARHRFGPDSARRSDALTWLGYTLRESGRYAEGIDALRKGASIAGRIRPYRQRLHVDALNALAQNLAIVGDTAKAQLEFERALAIEERKPGANGYLLGLLLQSLGTLHGNRGEYAAASGYFARAAPIYARVFGADSPKTLVLEKNRAETLLNLGHLDEAAAIFARIVSANDADPAANPGAVALLPYKNFATLRLWQHRYAESEALYRRFLELLGDGRDFNEVNPRSATAGLAAALWGQGRHAEAFAQAREAQRIATRARRNALDQLGERQLLAFEQNQEDVGGLAIAIAADARDPARLKQAWQLEMDAGSYVTRAMAMRAAAAAASGSDASLWRDWRDAGATLSSARVAATKAPDAAALAAVDTAQDALDAIERRIAAAERGRTGRLIGNGQSLDEVFAKLPDDAALVRFVEIDDYAPDRHRRPGGDAHLFALVRAPARAPHAIDLGPRAPLAERIAAWYALASAPRADERATSDAAKALRRALLDPLALDGTIRLAFMLPSSALAHVNFAALADESGRPLADVGPAFHLLNHESDLLRMPADAPHSLLLAGAGEHAGASVTPAFRAGCASTASALARPLPGAAQEIAALQAIARDRVARIDVLAGAAATENAVHAAMPGHSILHFATHAFAFDARCIDGTRSIALDTPVASSDRANDVAPLAALAFLPPERARGADDGLLTSEEIATLDLAAADWAVLSACETALGPSRGGEGVFGLRRAFRLAGAGGVVMSLWKVEDRATAEFMQALYRARLVDGADMPTAMRAAMRSVRAARRSRGESLHPSYWAGFVAAGRWR